MKKLLNFMMAFLLVFTFMLDARSHKGEDPNDGKPFIPQNIEYLVEV